MGPTLRSLLPAASLEEIWQKACWSLPAYQAYLSSLAAGEIARRGLEGAGALVESWVAGQLPGRAADFNAFRDAVESDLSLPLSESTPGALVQAVTQRLQAIEREAGLDFAAWNRELLGVSAPNEAVFQAALARGALAGLPECAAETLAARAPIQDLNAELVSMTLAQPSGRPVFCPRLEHPNPWGNPNLADDPAWRIRRYGYSSVPLLAEGEGGTDLAPAQVQAAFCQHPLAWIVVQLGLHAQIQANSGAGETLRLALERNPEGLLCALRIEFPGGAARHLGEALLQADILPNRSDGVNISDAFGRAAFESQYYQMLVKTPKPWRARLVEILKGE